MPTLNSRWGRSKDKIYCKCIVRIRLACYTKESGLPIDCEKLSKYDRKLIRIQGKNNDKTIVCNYAPTYGRCREKFSKLIK